MAASVESGALPVSWEGSGAFSEKGSPARSLGSLTGLGCEPALELFCFPKASSLHLPDRTLLLGPHLSLSLGPQLSEPLVASPLVWSKEHPSIPLTSGPGVSPGSSCLAQMWEAFRKFQGSCSYCWESAVMLRGCWRSVLLP